MRLGRQLARGFLTATIFLTLLSLSAPSVLAYQLLGGHWPYPNPLTYRNTILPLYKAYNAVENAIPTWDVNTQISFQKVSSGERLTFYANDYGPNWAGFTEHYNYWGAYDPTGSIDPYGSVKIKINLYYEFLGWPQLKIQAVAAHEIGHALGLAHVAEMNRLMYKDLTFYDVYGIYAPTQDEINGINYLYAYTVTVKTSGLSSSSYRTHVYVDSKDQFDVQGPYVYDGASRNLASRSGTHTIKVDQILSPATGQRYYCSSPQQSVSGTATITFTYVYQYRLSISIIGGLPGAQITDPPPGDYWYGSGSSVSVRAITCTEAVRFDHWELDGVNVGSQNPYTVTMNAPHNLVAVFVQT